jgi:hypothetical protein
MNRTKLLLSQGFESSSVKTPEFKSFASAFKRELTKELKSIGATNIKFSVGHFYVSGFFTSETGQVYYFSLSDVRGCPNQLMYRTAKDYKDYTGGINQWVNIENGMSNRMRII